MKTFVSTSCFFNFIDNPGPVSNQPAPVIKNPAVTDEKPKQTLITEIETSTIALNHTISTVLPSISNTSHLSTGAITSEITLPSISLINATTSLLNQVNESTTVHSIESSTVASLSTLSTLKPAVNVADSNNLTDIPSIVPIESVSKSDFFTLGSKSICIER